MCSEIETPLPSDVYPVAAALGAPLPAPVSSVVVHVSVTEHDDSFTGSGDTYEVLSNVYGSQGDAYTAVFRWILDYWATIGEYPWDTMDNGEDATIWQADGRRWLASRSPQQIVDGFMKDNPVHTLNMWTQTIAHVAAYNPATEAI